MKDSADDSLVGNLPFIYSVVHKSVLDGLWITQRDVADTLPLQDVLADKEVITCDVFKFNHQQVLEVEHLELQHSVLQAAEHVVDFVLVEDVFVDYFLVDFSW